MSNKLSEIYKILILKKGCNKMFFGKWSVLHGAVKLIRWKLANVYHNIKLTIKTEENIRKVKITIKMIPKINNAETKQKHY